MKSGYKKQVGIILGGAVLIVALGIIFTDPVAWGLCSDTSLVCRNYYSNIGQSVGLMAIAVILSLIPLFFTKEAVWKTWRKFAIIALPLMALAIYLSLETLTSGLGGPTMEMTRESAALILAPLFVAVSYLVIFVKANKLRAK